MQRSDAERRAASAPQKNASSTSGFLLLRPDDAAKADVAGRGVDRLALPRRRPVAEAVVGRAEMRAALDHLAREPLAREQLRRAARRLSAWLDVNESVVHSQTFPHMS